MDIDVLVNSKNPLDSNYVPDDLFITDENTNNFHHYVDGNEVPRVRSIIMPYFIWMCEDMEKEGLHIIVDSGYRSYSYQQKLIEANILKNGWDYTKDYVAHPGASEHQTGLAIDIAYIHEGEYTNEVTNDDAEVKWLKANSYKYGFILRYPRGKEKITGFKEEVWHYRFVGIKLAHIMHKYNLTLEEYHQNKDKYQKELHQIEEKEIITYAEILAAILVVKDSISKSLFVEIVNEYQRVFPDTVIIPSKFSYLPAIGGNNDVFHLRDDLITLDLYQELKLLTTDNLLSFVSNYLLESR